MFKVIYHFWNDVWISYFFNFKMTFRSKEIDSTKQYLHELVFRIKNMKPEEARNSVSLRGFKLLKDGTNVWSYYFSIISNFLLKENDELRERRSSIEREDSITDLFPMRQQPSEEIKSRRTNLDSRDRRNESRFMQRSRSKARFFKFIPL